MKRNYYYDQGMSGWAHVGYTILWSIPIVGWIIYLFHLWSPNGNVRGFARYFICNAIIALILIGLMVLMLFYLFSIEEIIYYYEDILSGVQDPMV